MSQFKILPGLKLIIIKYVGEVTPADILGILSRIVEELPNPSGFSTLATTIDAKVSFLSEDMVQILEWLSENGFGGTRLALVSGDPHGYGINRMWVSHAEGHVMDQNRIFQSVADACDWLGVPAREVEPALAGMG